MRTSERRRLLHEQLQRDAEKAARCAKRGLDDVIGRPEPHGNLKDALRNVNRSATRALDTAGVPDWLQGAGQEEWEDFE